MSERREIIMRRTGNALFPVNPAEHEALQTYPKDTDLWVSIRRKRSNAHHSKYWAMLERVIESGATDYHSSSLLHTALKYAMGYVKPVQLLSGTVIYEPDSIRFDRMDQIEFGKFYEEAVRLLAERYGIDMEELGREAN